MIEDLCDSPIFQGPRADRIRALIHPFDNHYNNRSAEIGFGAEGNSLGAFESESRRDGLG